MTRDQVIALVLARCVRTGDTVLQTSLESEIIFVIEQKLEKSAVLPWFLLSEYLTTAATPNDERLSLPVLLDGRRFLREYEDCALWIRDTIDTDWIELIKDNYDALYTAYGSAVGKPKKYALDGAYFYLKPTPDIAYTIRMRTYLTDLPLTSNIENSWLREAADLVIAELGYIAASKYVRDNELAGLFVIEAQEARRRLEIFTEARDQANRNYSMGGDDN